MTVDGRVVSGRLIKYILWVTELTPVPYSPVVVHVEHADHSLHQRVLVQLRLQSKKSNVDTEKML